jgi:hypothetical protein
MRQAFVHDAVLAMEPGMDPGAAGAAVTVALCGHWEHAPPCPLAPHHSDAKRAGDEVRLRILFAAEPAVESEVRRRIDAALAAGQLPGPDGVLARWQLRGSRRGQVAASEADHAERLIRG